LTDMIRRLLVIGIFLLVAPVVLGACATSPEVEIGNISPHEIQAQFESSRDDVKKEQAWRQFKGKQVRWIGELNKVIRLPTRTSGLTLGSIDVIGLGLQNHRYGGLLGAQDLGEGKVVGIFSPGGWGIYHPKNLDISASGKKPKLKPGGEGVFSPGGWGLVAVVFGGDEAKQLLGKEAASGLPTGKRQFRVGDTVVFEGKLASAKGVPGGEIGAEHGLSSNLKTQVNSSNFGLVNGIIIGGWDSFFER
ncbi:hypothetical protein ACFLX1_02675, partial [Chloroflexota bacterium]